MTPWIQGVDRFREALLAGAGFAHNQYRQVGELTGLHGPVENLSQRITLTKEAMNGEPPGELFLFLAMSLRIVNQAEQRLPQIRDKRGRLVVEQLAYRE